jgi:UDP-glucose 4-epimerase
MTDRLRVAVFGATGNVGSSLVRTLSMDDRIVSVRGIARRRPEDLELPKVSWATADIADDDLAPLLRDVDAVVHLAWAIQPSRDMARLRRTNLLGTAALLEAVAASGVPNLIYASSIGTYAPAPGDRRVNEDWPSAGVASSFYSRHKATVERMLDGFEEDHPSIRVVRMRPALTFKRSAGSEIRRLFLGPLFPGALASRQVAPFVPDVEGLMFQCVHTLDVADAYRNAIVSDVRGAFNITAEPPLQMADVADALGSRTVTVPEQVLRTGAGLSWRLRLQPTPPGWIDLALGAPLMAADRAREELDWRPRRSARETLEDLLEGLRTGAGEATPPLKSGGAGPFRVRELITGIGQRDAEDRRPAA